jgi:hypothetical protein
VPVAFTTDWYVNQGSQPVTIRSVSLIAPHGLVLHRALVYEMFGGRHVLYQAIAWDQLGRGALPSAWARRQPIPAAVIPPEHIKSAATVFDNKDNVYVVAEQITAASPAGGWALGQKLTYTAGGNTFSVEARTGIGIGSFLVPFPHGCESEMRIMKKAFGGRGSSQAG